MTAAVQEVVYERLPHGWWSVHCPRCRRGIAGSRKQITDWADAHECENR